MAFPNHWKISVSFLIVCLYWLSKSNDCLLLSHAASYYKNELWAMNYLEQFTETCQCFVDLAEIHKNTDSAVQNSHCYMYICSVKLFCRIKVQDILMSTNNSSECLHGILGLINWLLLSQEASTILCTLVLYKTKTLFLKYNCAISSKLPMNILKICNLQIY